MKPIVFVAALTYRRPADIRALLDELIALNSPDGWDVRFLIVDNDPEGSARASVEDRMSAFDGRLSYVVEPEPGIPAARNRALREGLGREGKLLCFLDDDERPAATWLAELVSHYERTGAMLIGGPLRRTMPETPLGPLQRLFAQSLITRRKWAETRAARAIAAGQPVPVYTSNWMCDLDIVRRHGLWFDTAMQFTGGSDFAFYLATRDRGIPTSWCPTAIVSEPITADRLTAAYQYRRSRDQGAVMAGLSKQPPARLVIEQSAKMGLGILLTTVPLLGIGSFSAGLHLVGSAMGHFGYLRGERSHLYARDQPSVAEGT